MAKVRMGMVGGGEGAFIGAVHRMAANLDGEIELVCGAFSRDAEKSRRSGIALHLAEDRIYADFHEMMAKEAALPARERMQFVAIVTPNHGHFPVAKAALQAGFHVLSDKPATLNMAEAVALRDIVNRTGLEYGLTHTYTGYPLVKEAKLRIAAGALGRIRRVIVEYSQGWLADRQEEAGNKQAAWRLDPAQAGEGGCVGDIGVHAANLAEYVTGVKISALCADLTACVEGRELDDDGAILLRFANGAKGVLMASQVSVGEENNLRINVYGDQGGVEWNQEEPNTLWLKYKDQPTQRLRTAGGYLAPLAAANTRTPMGHPEGYLEAFANVYMSFASRVRSLADDRPFTERSLDYQGIEDAVRGMAFIELAVAASSSDVKWHTLEPH